MALEAVAAVALAIAVLWLVLQPLIRPPSVLSTPFEPPDPEETPKGMALAALKEIEFDRETGKLSDADYDFLKTKYTAAALEALREEQAGAASDDLEALIAAKVRLLRFASAATSSNTPTCVSCGPRPEPDAVFCSSCGLRLVTVTSHQSPVVNSKLPAPSS
jgi:rRNA maturation endonuclease Nob1